MVRSEVQGAGNVPFFFKRASTFNGSRYRSRPTVSPSAKTLVEAILKVTPSEFPIPEDRDVCRQYFVKLAIHIQSLEKELERSRFSNSQVSVMDNPSPQSSVPEDDSSESVEQCLDDITGVDGVSDELARLTLDSLKKTHYFGESSNIMLAMTAMSHRSELKSSLAEWSSLFLSIKRPEFWEESSCPIVDLGESEQLPKFKFPGSEALYELIDAFFTNFHYRFPLLHRPSFERSIADGLHFRDAAFGALLLTVCTVASSFCPTSPQLDHEAQMPGWEWIRQIQIDHFVFGQPMSLHLMQMLCLYIHQTQTMCPHSDMAWVLSGIAVRLAQAVGIHRRKKHKQPTVESEQWKRVFWCLVQNDTFTSAWFGRPRATTFQDFDLEPLIECDDEYWETSDPDQAFVQPVGKPSIITGYNRFLKMLEIIGHAQKTIYGVRKRDSLETPISAAEYYKKALSDLDSALNKWLDSIPEHLQWNTEHQNDTFFRQSAMLYTLYYWVQIHVHRRFIPRPGESCSEYPCLEICTNAARSCLRVIEASCKRSFISTVPFAIPLFGSAMILIINLWKGIQNKADFDADKEMADVYKCINLMRLYESRVPVSGRLIDIVNTLIAASNYPPLLVSTPSPTSPYENVSPIYGTRGSGIDSARSLHANASASYSPSCSSSIKLEEPSPFYSSINSGSDPTIDPRFQQYPSMPVSPPSFGMNGLSESMPLYYDSYSTYPDFIGQGPRDDSPISDVNITLAPWATDANAWDSFMTNVDQMLYTGSTPTPVAPVPTYAYTA
ncbi:Gypsy retrotransposon integrase-like protein 1 [Stygiomarasmius scandens]|uniref:Gypsy retrotransposon integrase-like protein 1 n=1 Tax=Marasmiellus scandens TaxID=2682957 RepID=A0ABR1JSF4_9AGAR